MKKCIACAEEIQVNALLCRFCSVRQDDFEFVGRSIEGTQSRNSSDPKFGNIYTDEQAVKHDAEPKSQVSAVLMFILGFVPAGIWLAYMSALPNGGRWKRLSMGPCTERFDWGGCINGSNDFPEIIGLTIMLLGIAIWLFILGISRSGKPTKKYLTAG